MTALDLIFFLFVEPLKLLFEVIFFYAYKLTENAGLSIFIMSLAVNFLLLPLYFRADKLEKQQRDKKASMKYWTDFIKEKFKGDEKVMMLQTYYRENDYKSTDVLKESVSLFLQIPFFIAAYSFLSGLKILQGISLGPIPDLGSPDALIRIGALSINLLPVLMTVINIISGFIYSEKGNIKDKIKLILIALVFLVLLYDSPAGLVFYWTLNNIFSLCKNIVTTYIPTRTEKEKSVNTSGKTGPDNAVTMLSCTVLAVLTGIMIPADVISENPTELVKPFGTDPCNPVLYILSSALIAAGAFLIWIPLFTGLASSRTKDKLSLLFPAFAVTGTVNYVLLNRNFGNLSKKLIYEYAMRFLPSEMLINLLIDIGLLAAAAFIFLKLFKYRKLLLGALLAAVIAISGINIVMSLIITAGHNYSYANTEEQVSVPMTSTGKNVVVIMMDRMISGYIPYIFNERPDVAEQFSGFTYYPNTISLGHSTNNASPALFGGYDYSPANINARSGELLVDKHNEALRVMPQLFAQEGWNVTVGDPTYANYEWISDVSIYDDNKDIHAYNLEGVLTGGSDILYRLGEDYETRLNRNLFCYGLMKTMPYLLQSVIYAGGSYADMNLYAADNSDISRLSDPAHTQAGIDESYISARLVLESLEDITDINSDDTDCFFMFSNNTTHDISLLEEPSYEPAQIVDNTEYDSTHGDRFTVNGETMHMDDYLSYAQYECSMSACILLGDWFDYLRANDVYDNTRIIIVADHGYGIHQFDDLLFDSVDLDAQSVNPVLLVKDYGAEGFTVSYDFMTNADTPALALEGIIDHPVNPFTGNPIDQNAKEDDQLIYLSGSGNVLINNGTRFEEADRRWLTVRDNIFEESNWRLYEGDPN